MRPRLVVGDPRVTKAPGVAKCEANVGHDRVEDVVLLDIAVPRSVLVGARLRPVHGPVGRSEHPPPMEVTSRVREFLSSRFRQFDLELTGVAFAALSPNQPE